jgi:3-hydroxybutyrate dehydrogenase
VIVSSTNGQQASFATPVYAATKHAINGFVRSLGKLEQSHNIRVAAVAPGIMRTPMYLENPEKLSSIDQLKDAWSEPSEVAEVMLALIERDSIGVNVLNPECPDDAIKITGGCVIEATPGGAVRSVAPYNDPGPLGPGALASNILKLEDEIKSTLVPGWGVAGLPTPGASP